jgi:hypothetical protein
MAPACDGTVKNAMHRPQAPASLGGQSASLAQSAARQAPPKLGGAHVIPAPQSARERQAPGKQTLWAGAFWQEQLPSSRQQIDPAGQDFPSHPHSSGASKNFGSVHEG